MDTDGSITKSNGRYHVRFTTTSEKLKKILLLWVGYVLVEEKKNTGQ